MSQEELKKIAVDFLNAFYAKRQFDKIKGYLHDEVIVRAPEWLHSTADDFIDMLKKEKPVEKRMELKKVVVNGDNVGVFYEKIINTTQIIIVPVAEWFVIKEGKITEIHTYYDPRPLEN